MSNYGLYLCIALAGWYFGRGANIRRTGDIERARVWLLRFEIWAAAAVVIGSLK